MKKLETCAFIRGWFTFENQYDIISKNKMIGAEKMINFCC